MFVLFLYPLPHGLFFYFFVFIYTASALSNQIWSDTVVEHLTDCRVGEDFWSEACKRSTDAARGFDGSVGFSRCSYKGGYTRPSAHSVDLPLWCALRPVFRQLDTDGLRMVSDFISESGSLNSFQTTVIAAITLASCSGT